MLITHSQKLHMFASRVPADMLVHVVARVPADASVQSLQEHNDSRD